MPTNADNTNAPRSIVSIADLSQEEILSLIRLAAYFEERPNSKLLDGKVVATLFFEPSHTNAAKLRDRSQPPSADES